MPSKRRERVCGRVHPLMTVAPSVRAPKVEWGVLDSNQRQHELKAQGPPLIMVGCRARVSIACSVAQRNGGGSDESLLSSETLIAVLDARRRSKGGKGCGRSSEDAGSERQPRPRRS